jgi:flagellar motor switch protein FliG
MIIEELSGDGPVRTSDIIAAQEKVLQKKNELLHPKKAAGAKPRSGN